MWINILYLGLARDKIGKKTEEYEVKDGTTLADLLCLLSAKYGNIVEGVFDMTKESRLDPSFVVTVNRKTVDLVKDKCLELKEKDTVAFMTLIGGGVKIPTSIF